MNNCSAERPHVWLDAQDFLEWILTEFKKGKYKIIVLGTLNKWLKNTKTLNILAQHSDMWNSHEIQQIKSHLVLPLSLYENF